MLTVSVDQVCGLLTVSVDQVCACGLLSVDQVCGLLTVSVDRCVVRSLPPSLPRGDRHGAFPGGVGVGREAAPATRELPHLWTLSGAPAARAQLQTE